jgi:hypothetical protein
VNPLEDDEDAWPNEPEEFDPESLGPESPGSSSVDSQVKESLGATADVDEDLFRAFWGAVVFLNVALAALSIGAMLVYFRGDWAMGGPALLVGTIAAGFTVRFYLDGKRLREQSDDGSDEDDGQTAEKPDAEADTEEAPES